jgi:hypothetical protein
LRKPRGCKVILRARPVGFQAINRVPQQSLGIAFFLQRQLHHLCDELARGLAFRCRKADQTSKPQSSKYRAAGGPRASPKACLSLRSTELVQASFASLSEISLEPSSQKYTRWAKNNPMGAFSSRFFGVDLQRVCTWTRGGSVPN